MQANLTQIININMVDNLKRSMFALKAKTPYEKSLLKATYDGDFDPPKEKHVQTVILALQGQNMQTTPESAFSLLTQRMTDGHWAAVLKAEMILHRAIEHVGTGFCARLAELNIPMQNFCDPSEKGSAHNRIVQDYFAYIRTNATNKSRKNSILTINASDRARAIERMSEAELAKETGSLIAQLQELVKMGPSCQQAIRNYNLKLTQSVVYWILLDSNGLYKTTAMLTDALIDKFSQLDRQSAGLALDHLQKFDTCTRVLGQFFELANSLPFSGLSAPSYVNRPKEVIASLKSFVDGSEGVRPPQQREEELELPPDMHLTSEEVLSLIHI